MSISQAIIGAKVCLQCHCNTPSSVWPHARRTSRRPNSPASTTRGSVSSASHLYAGYFWTHLQVVCIASCTVRRTLTAIIHAGTVLMVPYGVRALSLRASLPSFSTRDSRRVRLARDVRYGPLTRNTLDVYVPPTPKAASGSFPVCLFCHGGVWASGMMCLVYIAHKDALSCNVYVWMDSQCCLASSVQLCCSSFAR